MAIVHSSEASNGDLTNEEASKNGEKITNVKCHDRKHAIEQLVHCNFAAKDEYLQQVSDASLNRKYARSG